MKLPTHFLTNLLAVVLGLFANTSLASSLGSVADRPLIAIVDPFSSGRDMPFEIRKRGYECVAVQSDVVFQNNGGNFAAFDGCPYKIPYNGDLAATMEKLKMFAPLLVAPGNESGVPYADELAEALGLPGNGTAKSAQRRNKFLMHQEVAKARIRVPSQSTAQSYQEAMAFIAKTGLSFPVVVKPQAGTGSQGVFVCASPADVAKAYDDLIGAKDILGNPTSELIIQEYLGGQEFAIDTVTSGGEHYVTSIWAYRKGEHNGSKTVYESTDLVPYDGESQTKAVAYVKEVLSALGVQVGAAHTEVKLNDKGEVFLIEVGARLAGSSLHRLVQAASIDGKSQLEYLFDAYLEPQALRALEDGYKLKHLGQAVSLISGHAGTIVDVPGLTDLVGLPGYVGHTFKVGVGDPLKVTRDLITSPGIVYMVGSQSELQARYAALREAEKRLFAIQ